MSWERKALLDVHKLRSVFSKVDSSSYKVIRIADDEELDVKQLKKNITTVSCFWDFIHAYTHVIDDILIEKGKPVDNKHTALVFVFDLEESKVDLKADEVDTYLRSLQSCGHIPRDVDIDMAVNEGVVVIRNVDEMYPAQFYIYLCNIRSIIGEPNLVRMVAHLVNKGIHPLTAISLSFVRRLSDRSHHYFRLVDIIGDDVDDDGGVDESLIPAHIVRLDAITKGNAPGQHTFFEYAIEGNNIPKYGCSNTIRDINIGSKKVGSRLKKAFSIGKKIRNGTFDILDFNIERDI